MGHAQSSGAKVGQLLRTNPCVDRDLVPEERPRWRAGHGENYAQDLCIKEPLDLRSWFRVSLACAIDHKRARCDYLVGNQVDLDHKEVDVSDVDGAVVV